MPLHSTLTYTCNICREVKEESCFAFSDNKRGKRYECKLCYNKKSRAKDRVVIRTKEKARYEDPKFRFTFLVRNAKQRAKEKGFDFEIDKEFVEHLYEKQNKVCAVTNRPFVFETNGVENRHMYSPSIDRVDSSKGYTKDNIQLVTYHYNLAKSVYTHEDLLQMLKDIENASA